MYLTDNWHKEVVHERIEWRCFGMVTTKGTGHSNRASNFVVWLLFQWQSVPSRREAGVPRKKTHVSWSKFKPRYWWHTLAHCWLNHFAIQGPKGWVATNQVVKISVRARIIMKNNAIRFQWPQNTEINFYDHTVGC